MRPKTTTKSLIVLALLATALPEVSAAKPNSYPGENSRFKSTDPAVIAQQKAERQKKIELRKQRRAQKRQERLLRKNSRSN